MGRQPPPNFEEWVHYCFTQGWSDFWNRHADGDEARDARKRRFGVMTPTLLTGYLTRLFEAPRPLAKRYTDKQIGEAVHFIFGGGSEYIQAMLRGPVSPEEQTRCIRAVTTFYTDLLDRVCGRRGTEPDAELIASELDGAVFMIWDMGGLECAVMSPKNFPHLVEPGIRVLECVLERCRTSACRQSALHGIAHIYFSYSCDGDKAIAARLQGIVDKFLERRDMRTWLREYAQAARVGAVQ